MHKITDFLPDLERARILINSFLIYSEKFALFLIDSTLIKQFCMRDFPTINLQQINCCS